MEKQRSTIATVGYCTGISLLAFVLYVASYPIAINMSAEHGFPDDNAFVTYLSGTTDGYHFYSPVNWMIDETPLRTPMIAWCHLFGAGSLVEQASDLRITMKYLKPSLIK